MDSGDTKIRYFASSNLNTLYEFVTADEVIDEKIIHELHTEDLVLGYLQLMKDKIHPLFIKNNLRRNALILIRDVDFSELAHNVILALNEVLQRVMHFAFSTLSFYNCNISEGSSHLLRDLNVHSLVFIPVSTQMLINVLGGLGKSNIKSFYAEFSSSVDSPTAKNVKQMVDLTCASNIFDIFIYPRKNDIGTFDGKLMAIEIQQIGMMLSNEISRNPKTSYKYSPLEGEIQRCHF